MSVVAAKTNLLGMSQDMLEQLFADWQEKPFRARQIMQWIYQRGVIDFDEMTDLSKKLRARLVAETEIRLPQVQSRFDSCRRHRQVAVRYRLRAGRRNGLSSPSRGAARFASPRRSGCALDCAFCATGAQGFNRNLTSAAEIIGQVFVANQELPRRDNGDPAVTNVVLMGMGEPLANYRNVVPVLKVLISDWSYGLSRRRVTVSTSGIVPHMNKLADDCNVSLAVSLHAPNDAHCATRSYRSTSSTRSRVCSMPAGPMRRSTRIASSRSSTSCCAASTTRSRMPTSSTSFFNNKPAKVNLIPFNPFPGNRIQALLCRYNQALPGPAPPAGTRRNHAQDARRRYRRGLRAIGRGRCQSGAKPAWRQEDSATGTSRWRQREQERTH